MGRVTLEDSLPGSVVLIVEPVTLGDEQLFICHVNSADEGGAESSTKLRVFSGYQLRHMHVCARVCVSVYVCVLGCWALFIAYTGLKQFAYSMCVCVC